GDRRVHRRAAYSHGDLSLRRGAGAHLARHGAAHQLARRADPRREVPVDALLDLVSRPPARRVHRRVGRRRGVRSDPVVSTRLARVDCPLGHCRGAVRADQRTRPEARVKDESSLPAQTQRLASLGFMVASVCHEVSNPLAAVSSMLQILQSKRGVTPETLERGLASIEANIARVMAITKKLGDYSRVGGMPQPLAIDDAVQTAQALLRHSPAGRTVAVDYRGVPGVTVRSRPGELEQVVFNIFLNAAQA